MAWPGSLSYGLVPAPGMQSIVRSFKVANTDKVAHTYTASGSVRYSDFNPSIASIGISLTGNGFATSRTFTLGKGKSRRVFVRLRLDPSVVSPAEQSFGWFYFNPNVDGTVKVTQDAPHKDKLQVAWHVTPLATASNALSASSLDLTGGPASLTMTEPSAAGQSYGDLYQLGTTDPVGSTGEEDIVAVGTRSFTGSTIDGVAQGLPTGTDALTGSTWLQFLTNVDEPTEPVEFVVQGAGIRNTTETLEVDILVDAGADGVFADPALQADYMVVKPTGSGRHRLRLRPIAPEPVRQLRRELFRRLLRLQHEPHRACGRRVGDRADRSGTRLRLSGHLVHGEILRRPGDGNRA